MPRLLRRRTLERRLFAWLLALTLLPALLVLGTTAWVGRGALQWFGTLGPWAEVSESGRELVDAIAPIARTDTTIARAAERHRSELSASLVQAGRWSFLGHRVLGLLPWLVFIFALLLAAIALYVSRKLARELSRPINELVDWSDRIAQNQSLPDPAPRERREVREVQSLRQSFRRAAVELSAARERALQQERVRAWGEMARRVAHEMKNPLTPLRLAAHRLQATATESSSVRESLIVIDEETARLEALAKQFSQLGRPADGPRSDIDLVELLGALLESDVPPDINTELVAPERELPQVYGDYNALRQAFRNIVRNAVEALEGRAAPAIRVSVGVSAADANILTARIEDNGPGLPDTPAMQLFEPDFTGKARGTGLGLAIALQSVQAHGGSISAESAKDGGAAFIVTLPSAGTATSALE